MISFKLHNPKFEKACHDGAKFAKGLVDGNYKLTDVKVAIRVHLLSLEYTTAVAEKSAHFIVYGK